MGIRDKVRGKTKDECWEKYQDIARDVKDRYYMEPTFPYGKEDAYEKMIKDEETGEFVLAFHFDN